MAQPQANQLGPAGSNSPVVIYNINANATVGTNPQQVNSTKLKVAANVHIYVNYGPNASCRASNVACAIIPPNTITTVDLGPGNLYVVAGNGTPISMGGPYVSFLSTSGMAQVSFTEIGLVNFNNVAS